LAFLVDGERAVQMYSTSTRFEDNSKDNTNAVGRMNRLLTWECIKYFKNKEYKIYEWGGIHSSENPNGIDKFKMEFGGEIKKFYNYTIPKSLKGAIYVWLVKIISRKRNRSLDN
jgi:lipid II:glycine glycyltransferase (peptidoglycan interpeptide bridge formation enzyme)